MDTVIETKNDSNLKFIINKEAPYVMADILDFIEITSPFDKLQENSTTVLLEYRYIPRVY